MLHEEKNDVGQRTYPLVKGNTLVHSIKITQLHYKYNKTYISLLIKKDNSDSIQNIVEFLFYDEKRRID